MVFTPHFIFWSLILATVYLIVSLFLINIEIVKNIIQNSLSFSSTVQILFIFLQDFLLHLSRFQFVTLLVISALFGLNIQLAFLKVKSLSRQKNLKLTFGIGIVSIAASGCGGCGFSLISILGISGSLALMPFGGKEVSIAAITILALTLLYNIKSLYSSCTLPIQSKAVEK